MSIVFVVMGVMLSCVGVFPLSFSILLHNTSAIGMAVAFLVLLFASPWWLTGLPGRFFVVSFAFAAALIVGALLFYPVQYFNLTAYELVAFAQKFWQMLNTTLPNLVILDLDRASTPWPMVRARMKW